MATGRVPTTANSPLTAKGDLFGYSTTQARVAVGNDGETLVADSSTSTGLRYTGNFAAGKNKFINGDFNINQRNFTSVTSTGNFLFDRFLTLTGGTATTYNFTPQTFTPGSAPVAGYEGKNFLQCAITVSTGAYIVVGQRIEDVRTFAGQTITVSLWAKAATGTPSISIVAAQDFGTGGSSGVNTFATKQTISTAWTRYSFNINVPSISGKTIGTNSNLFIYVALSDNLIGTGVGDQTGTFSIWGLQAEAGSVATAFQTATGTIQGELAACQRYFYSWNTANANDASGNICYLAANTSVAVYGTLQYPVTMRTSPSFTSTAASGFQYYMGGARVLSALSQPRASIYASMLNGAVTGATVGQAGWLEANNNTGYLWFSAEL